MTFRATTFTMAGILIAAGCRSAYNPTPPPYYCQPACGYAPAVRPRQPMAHRPQHRI